VYLQLLLGWGEHGLPGAVCATVALSHIAAAAAILSPSSATNLGVPAVLNETHRNIMTNKTSHDTLDSLGHLHVHVLKRKFAETAEPQG
jgi:hypothetical protein